MTTVVLHFDISDGSSRKFQEIVMLPRYRKVVVRWLFTLCHALTWWKMIGSADPTSFLHVLGGRS